MDDYNPNIAEMYVKQNRNNVFMGQQPNGLTQGNMFFGQHQQQQTNPFNTSNKSPLMSVDTRFKFRLASQEDEEFAYKPEEREFSFYQICQFAINNKHKVKKLIYNEYGEIMKEREKYIGKSTLNKFIRKCPEYKYTIYPAYDLDVVGYPQEDEILLVRSQILNGY